MSVTFVNEGCRRWLFKENSNLGSSRLLLINSVEMHSILNHTSPKNSCIHNVLQSDTYWTLKTFWVCYKTVFRQMTGERRKKLMRSRYYTHKYTFSGGNSMFKKDKKRWGKHLQEPFFSCKSAWRGTGEILSKVITS